MTDKVVLYLDGGAESPRGVAGWGIHGYTYVAEVPKQGTGRVEYCSAIGYVDLTAATNNGVTAVPDKVTPIEYIDYLGPLSPSFTNNEAELLAAINAFRLCKERGWKNVQLLLDSDYVLKGTTLWMPAWRARNWTKPNGEIIPNKDHWIALVDLKEQLEADGVVIKWAHVDGHSGDLGNTIADRHCWRAKWSAFNGILEPVLTISPAKGYWSKSVKYNRMLSHPRWYFNAIPGDSNVSADGRYIYHCGTHGPDNKLWGKPDSATSYSVLFLKEQDAVLEAVRTKQQQFLRNHSIDDLFIGRLDTIRTVGVYSEISEHSTRFLFPRKMRIDLYDPCDNILTEEVTTPYLSKDGLAAITIVELLLCDYVNNSDKITVTDITKEIYDEVVEKKKTIWKLKPTIDNTSLKVTVNYMISDSIAADNITLTVGTDIVDKNTLSALAGLHPKVSVITWKESHAAYRFATIIETSDDVGIWCGYYQNLRLVLPIKKPE